MELSPEASAEMELRKLPSAKLPELYFRRCLKGKLHLSFKGSCRWHSYNSRGAARWSFPRGVCGNGAPEARPGRSFRSSISADASRESCILALKGLADDFAQV